MSDKKKVKVGAGHAQAMARLGLAELREAFNPSRESIARHEDAGLYGMALPSEVAAQRGSEPQKGVRPTFDDRMAEAANRANAARDARGGWDAPELDKE